ncbi:MAG: KH domain-containing protein [Clostridia bacterium]|nr:KH domain-containing protein [Clostridia bacterium]
MKQTLIDIAKAIVDKPDEVSVTEKVSGDTYVLELSVAKDDMGKVIGRQGRIAKCIRIIMRANAMKQNKRVIVDIVPITL